MKIIHGKDGEQFGLIISKKELFSVRSAYGLSGKNSRKNRTDAFFGNEEYSLEDDTYIYETLEKLCHKIADEDNEK